jgi:hypothetical protein
VVSTDGNVSNVEENKRRHPKRNVQLLNLESEGALDTLSGLGQFDIVFCYGVLYHLSKPERALNALATLCREMILLETCVAPGTYSELHLLRDPETNDMAISGIGCRPTRAWVMKMLKRYFGYAYITRTQPRHPDFPTDWRMLPTQLLYRSVFVGSKRPLVNENLLKEIPEHQG